MMLPPLFPHLEAVFSVSYCGVWNGAELLRFVSTGVSTGVLKRCGGATELCGGGRETEGAGVGRCLHCKLRGMAGLDVHRLRR